MPLPDNGRDREAASFLATSTTEGDGAPARRVVAVSSSGGTPTVDTELPAARLMAAGLTLPTAPDVLAGLMGYNGTTLDPVMTGAIAAAGVSAATGILQALGVAQYNSTNPTVTNGNYGHLQIGSRGSLRVELWSANQASAAFSVVQTAADALANPAQVGITTYGMAYNGTTWDRLRSIINATNSVGTGIAAVGLVAQLDDTSPTTITENQFGNVRMSPTRALYHEDGPYIMGRVTADGQIKGSAGFLHTISVSVLTATPTAGLLTIYDSLTETGTILYTMWVPTTLVSNNVRLDVPFGTGLYVAFDATLASVAVTVSYR